MENKKPKDPQRKKLFRQVLITAAASTLIATGASIGITYAIASKQLKLPSYTVTFKNWDGTILQQSKIQIGADAKYTGATPTRPTENYVDFTFKGWDRDLTNIIADREITAQYNEAFQTYTMTWYSDEAGTQVYEEKTDCHKQDVAAGKEAVATKPVPTKASTSTEDFGFNKWEYYGDWEKDGKRYAKPVFDSKQSGLTIEDGEIKSFSGNATVVEIPKTWNGVPVTTIGSNIFNTATNGSAVEKIIIHNNITTIKNSAFEGASKLTSVQFDDDCQITEIPAYAFKNCSELTEFVIPNSVTTVGNRAFQDCKKFSKVTLGKNTTQIDEGAFVGCTALKDIAVTSGNTKFQTVEGLPGVLFGYDPDRGHILVRCLPAVTSIETSKLPTDLFIITSLAFQGCSLTSLDLSSCQNLIAIDEYAFAGSSLTTFNTGNSVKMLGAHLFQGCTSLTTINLGKNVQAEGILTNTLSGCNSITEINVDAANSELSSQDGVLYKKDDNCTLLRCPIKKPSFTWKEACKAISANALEGCLAVSGTKDAPYTIPSHIEIIGNEAFKNCNNLQCVKLGEGNIKSLGDDLFTGCANLEQIIVGKAQTFDYSMNTKALAGCSSLLKIVVDSENKNFSAGEDGVLYGIKDNVKSLVKYPAAKKTDTDFVIPEGTTFVAKSSFDGCRNLTSVTFASTITGIFEKAFNDCENLTTIYIQPGFTIPRQSDYFKTDIFDGCMKLNRLVLRNIDGNQTSIVPEIYKRLPQTEKTLTLELDINSGVQTAIEKSAFAGVTGFTNLIIKTGITQIYEKAFNGCTSLKTVSLPEGLETISDRVFLGCTALTSISIPKSLTKIDEGAFGDCRSLTSLDWSNTGIKYIESSAFGSATKLASIILPNTITYIGGSAFGQCTKLSYVEFKGTIAEFNTATENNPWKPFPHSTLLSKIKCSDGDIDIPH